MDSIYDLQKRASALRAKTQVNSITPEDVGGLQCDTLAYMAYIERECGSLGIRKVYPSLEVMEADVSPLGLNEVPLRLGQLVTIYNATEPTAEHTGEIYAYKKPGWLLIGNLTNLRDSLYNYDELLRRVQGTSLFSDPHTDPFVLLDSVGTIEDVNVLLDGLHSRIAADHKCGSFRILFGDAPIFVENIVLYYAEDKWMQCVRGRIQVSGDGNSVVLSSGYHILKRSCSEGVWSPWSELTITDAERSFVGWLHSAGYLYRGVATPDTVPPSSLQMPVYYSCFTPGTYTHFGGVVLTRPGLLMYNTTEEAPQWRAVPLPRGFYEVSKNYGKKVQVFGGSVSVLAESEAAKERWRNYLGMTVESVGHTGAGFYTVGDKYAMRAEQFVEHCRPARPAPYVSDLFNAVPYQALLLGDSDTDVFVLWMSTNDFTGNVPAGSYKDELSAGTMCGGLNETITILRDKNPQAEIYFFTPLPYFYEKRSSDQGYNPKTGTFNATGKSFAQYIEAAREVCANRGVPMLDLFSLSGLCWETRELYYKKEETGVADNPYEYFHLTRAGYERVSPLMTDFLSNGTGSGSSAVGAGRLSFAGICRADVQDASWAEGVLGTLAEGELSLFVVGNGDDAISGGSVVLTESLGKLFHPGDARVGANLGDIMLIGRFQGRPFYTILPQEDAKAKDEGTGFPGTYGIVTPNDKKAWDQAVEDIDKRCFRCYQGEYNMNDCVWYGYYMFGTTGRPVGSLTGEQYLLRVAHAGKDSEGNLLIHQTCWSCLNSSRMFSRVLRVGNRSDLSTVVYEDWKQEHSLVGLGDFETTSDLIGRLNRMTGEGVSAWDSGLFFATVQGSPVEIKNFVISYGNQIYAQQITSRFALNPVKVAEVDSFTLENGADVAYYRNSYSDGFSYGQFLRTYTRQSNQGVWSSWTDAATAPWTYQYRGDNTRYYNKRILLIVGGSFGQNANLLTSASYKESIEDGAGSLSLTDVLARRLGYTDVWTFAIGSNGHHPDFAYNTLTQIYDASERLQTISPGRKFDDVLIFGGLNDFMAGKEPGTFDGGTDANTMCGGLLDAIDFARTEALRPGGRVLALAPFKWYHDDWGDAGWNPLSTRRNDIGYAMSHYVRAFRRCCYIKSVPVLDLSAVQQFGDANVGTYYMEDKTHPNGEGYAAVADALTSFMRTGIGTDTQDVFVEMPRIDEEGTLILQ